MNKNSKIIILLISGCMICLSQSCKKTDFDINSPNPNTPSAVAPKFVLSAALTSSASLMLGGNADFANTWMGYWAVYGITSSSTLSYNITNDFFSGNWDNTYITLENYKFIEDQSTDPADAYFLAIARIMKVFHFQRLVDMYNNVPYSEALISTNNFPKFDDGYTIYKDLVTKLDSAVAIISAAPVSTTNSPGSNDVVFQGDMNNWKKFANTLKLKILMRLTQLADGTAYITAHVTGLTTNDFLAEGADAAVNPGYTNASRAQQSPLWQDVGYSTNGTPSGNNQAYRANSYAVNFYRATNDTARLILFYAPNDAGQIRGRAYGSSDVGQSNSIISGIGSGILSAPNMNANLIPAFESLFIQAEAVSRGFIAGDATALFKSAVTESFRLLGVDGYQSAAQNFYSQPSDKVNIDVSGNKLTTIILQKWAALNAYDALEAYSDWRRLGIPADLPVSVYPGTTATHIPYRLLYPTSEFQYNAKNVNAEGTISQFTSKIFWMP